MGWIKRHKVFCSLIFVFAIWLGYVSIAKGGTQKASFSHVVSKGTMMECVYGIGTVAANKNYLLKTGVTGNLKALFVKEGDRVEQGDKLAQQETLFTAPFSGTVTAVFCHEGETVFSASNILELTDLCDRYIAAVLDQKSAMRVCKGQAVKLSFESLRGEVFNGTVAAIYPCQNKFRIRVDIGDLPEKILPGMTADLSIEIKEHSDILMIPMNAIDKNQVFVKRADAVLPIAVRIGISDGNMAEVLSSDLREGDELLLSSPLEKR